MYEGTQKMKDKNIMERVNMEDQVDNGPVHRKYVIVKCIE
jgi:hypothetical protein